MNDFLNPEQQNFLLKLARETIRCHLEGKKAPKVKVTDPSLKEKRGAFVTLRVNKELRGCIGYPIPYKPLYKTIIDVAVSSATQDFRFQSLGLEELPKTRIEISSFHRPNLLRISKRSKRSLSLVPD